MTTHERMSRSPLFPVLLALVALAGAVPAAGAGGEGRPGFAPVGSVATLAVSPLDPSVLFAGTVEGGVFRSVDGAESWQPASRGLPARATVLSLVFDPDSPSVLYARTDRGELFRSTDSASSWRRVSDPAGDLSLAVGPRLDPERWGRADLGPEVTRLWSLTFDPFDARRVFAGTLGQGAYGSEDGGRSWQWRGEGLPPFADVLGIAIDPSEPEVLYAATGRGLYRSVDGADHWKPTGAALADSFVLAVAIDPFEPRTLYAGTVFGGVFKSSDGGEAWRASNLGLEAGVLVDVPVRGSGARPSAALLDPFRRPPTSSRPGPAPTRARSMHLPGADLLITEADVNQAGFPDLAELVEIRNHGDEAVRLDDFQLVHLAYNWWSLRIVRRLRLPDVELAPGAHFVVCGDPDRVAGCDQGELYELNDANGVLAIVHNPGEDPADDVLVDSFAWLQYYPHGLGEGPGGEPWLRGSVHPLADGTTAIIAPPDTGYVRSCAGGVLSTTGDSATDFVVAPISPGEDSCLRLRGPVGPVAERACATASYACSDPLRLSLAIDGADVASLGLRGDLARSPGSSTFCASTAGLADGFHELAVTVDCRAAEHAAALQIEVIAPPFRLVEVTPDKARYTTSDTVRLRVELTADAEVTADFSALDPGKPEPDEVRPLGPPGLYEVVWDFRAFDITAAPGTYSVPVRASAGGVTRELPGVRIAFVGEADHALEPADGIPTQSVLGRLAGGDSPARIRNLTAGKSVILPRTTVVVTGEIDSPFLTGVPRRDAEIQAPRHAVAWREVLTNLTPAGAYLLRPGSLELDCGPGPDGLCAGARFRVELELPDRKNPELSPDRGIHGRTLQFAVRDPLGELSELAEVEVLLVPLGPEVFGGTTQDQRGRSTGGMQGAGGEFQLVGERTDNPVIVVMTWDGDNGPGANRIPVPGPRFELDALDLNLGLQIGDAQHRGWFAEAPGGFRVLRKANTCFSGRAQNQIGPDRSFCVCGDSSTEINMEVMGYPTGAALPRGIDGEGTLKAEYYIYDSCGAKRDTIATITAYYCGTSKFERYVIPARRSEERMDLDTNFGAPCPHGQSCWDRVGDGCTENGSCFDPKQVPTGVNENGGNYPAFEFNPTRCRERPFLTGNVSYRAPVVHAVNDPDAPGCADRFDPDPRLDTSWSCFNDDTADATGWKTYLAPYVRVDVRQSSGERRIVGTTFTDAAGEFRVLLDPDWIEGGDPGGLVDFEVVAESATPWSFRVVEDADVGEPHRIVFPAPDLVSEGVPRRLELLVNEGPEDEERKEGAAALHMLRNAVLAAEWVYEETGRVIEPVTFEYRRDDLVILPSCDVQTSRYFGDRQVIYIQSVPGDTHVEQICPTNVPSPEGDDRCAVPCEDEENGTLLPEARDDFNYHSHLHQFLHHVIHRLTLVRANPEEFPRPGRGSARSGPNASEKTALAEGLAIALGGVAASRVIYDRYGDGVPMNPILVRCPVDDLGQCPLEGLENLDWLTPAGTEPVRRPGPDWQPQKDCLPGDPGCGCFHPLPGGCRDPDYECNLGFCVQPEDRCQAGAPGCRPTSQGFCNSEQADRTFRMVPYRGFCVVTGSYDESWVWRVLWDLLDGFETGQPEASHWRQSQMETTNNPPSVPNPYDLFGRTDLFWDVLLEVFRSPQILVPSDPIDDIFHPRLGDFIEAWRCELVRRGLPVESFDVYIDEVVELPYYDPADACR